MKLHGYTRFVVMQLIYFHYQLNPAEGRLLKVTVFGFVVVQDNSIDE